MPASAPVAESGVVSVANPTGAIFAAPSKGFSVGPTSSQQSANSNVGPNGAVGGGQTINAPANEATVISSEQGAQDVAKNNNTISSLKPAPTSNTTYPVGSTIDQGNGPMKVTGTNADGSPILTPANPSNPTLGTGTGTGNGSGSPATPSGNQTYNGKVTFLNPETNQQQEIDANQLTPALKASLDSQGYYSVSSTGTIPAWFVTGNTQQAELEAQTKAATDKVNSLVDHLSTMQATMDAQSAQQIQLIKNQYAGLITNMTAENAARLQAVQTTGYRLGMQYSGGSGGPFGGIITAEIAAGQGRIATLQNQMQSAVLAAEQAQQNNDWKIYDEQVTAAQNYQKEMQSQLDTLNNNLQTQNQKLQDKITQANIDSQIATLMKSGTTDPAAILKSLNDQGLNATASDVAAALKNLQPTDAGNISTIAQSAAKNGAPASVIDAISKAGTTDAAIAAAGGYLQEGSGDVGDYLQYKRDAMAAGQTPEDFQTYYNAKQQAATALDVKKATQIAYATAAAKAQADLASGVLSSNDQTVISGADNDLNKGAVGTQMQQVAEQYGVISAIPSDTTDPTQQNQLLLALAQMEVPGAKTVRGVLNVNTPDSLQSGIYNLLKSGQQKLDNQGLLSSDTIKAIQSAAKRIYDSQSTAYNNLYNETVQTTNSRLKIDNANEYITNLSSIGSGDTGSSLIQSETDAQNAVVDYVKSNPTQQDTVTKMLGQTDANGKPYTYQEIAQILGVTASQ